MRALLFSLFSGSLLLSAGQPPNLASIARDAGPHTQPFDASKYAQVRYVAAGHGSDASGDGSAARPWQSIARAMQSTSSPAAGHRAAILVAAGVYTGAAIQMKPRVDLFGGFTTDWKRDIAANPSILDGQSEHRLVNASDDATLDGFTFRNGRVRGFGGAVLCDGTSPRLSNNVFTGNSTLPPESWKPDHWHESANDGGAIACRSHCSAVIEHNRFENNFTEVGRGGAIAVAGHSSARIIGNLVMDNRTGLSDPSRSSDGGGISIFDHSNGEISGNVVQGNQNVNKNDGGGVFVALWSAPSISNNLIVGNQGSDDGGGLFVGGQQHHYGTPFDPVPPASQFDIHVTGNAIIGNVAAGGPSGAMRITMETRGEFDDNLVARNQGAMYFQRSEIRARDNIIAGDLLFVESKSTVKPGVFQHDLFGGTVSVQAPASFENCFMGPDAPFLPDGMTTAATTVSTDKRDDTTRIGLSHVQLEPNEWTGRVLRIGKTFLVIRGNQSNAVTVWGQAVVQPGEAVEILPSYRPIAGKIFPEVKKAAK
ncbi:MAG TPA: right-handed parallel beta-helix repeat-containing protein [Bryobacteraceae bacterium]|nr:right-handed parallel beta-helix repeat-containing protein [Bryobacteraceae bacterium]